MRRTKNPWQDATIELTRNGVFQKTKTAIGKTETRKIGRLIRLRALGRREPDGATFGQVRFRTIHGDYRQEFFPMSNFLPENRREIKVRLADLGYQWPEDDSLSRAILNEVAMTQPKRRFRMVSAPGWYDGDATYVIRGRVFVRGAKKPPEIYIDPASAGHVGAFVLEGSLRGWQETVAIPSRKSSRLRLAIAASLAAPFLRPLGVDSFGLNLFSQTSDGKTLASIVAASAPGLMGPEGLPGWADSEAAIEDLLFGHRDGLVPLEEAADGEHQMAPEKKGRMLAFLLARNRPRKLAKVYERNNNLQGRETRNIVISSSERALGQIARAAGKGRLGGEEVRFIDIPASDPGSSGIFDGNIKPAPGKTLRETTKELIETLRANANKHQGYAFDELLEKYVNDKHGLETLRKYKEQFEAEAEIPDKHNAHFRVRSNFAVMYGAAALAIDYGILPWKKGPTFRAVEKCMRLALATMTTGGNEPAVSAGTVDPHVIGQMLNEHIAKANIVVVTPKKKVTEKQAQTRQRADGFAINGMVYVKPKRFRKWIPSQPERNALKEQKVIRTDRNDTATIEKKIGGIAGKLRYYAVDIQTLRRLATGFDSVEARRRVG
jgi:hypothetical protein